MGTIFCIILYLYCCICKGRCRCCFGGSSSSDEPEEEATPKKTAVAKKPRRKREETSPKKKQKDREESLYSPDHVPDDSPTPQRSLREADHKNGREDFGSRNGRESPVSHGKDRPDSHGKDRPDKDRPNKNRPDKNCPDNDRPNSHGKEHLDSPDKGHPDSPGQNSPTSPLKSMKESRCSSHKSSPQHSHLDDSKNYNYSLASENSASPDSSPPSSPKSPPSLPFPPRLPLSRKCSALFYNIDQRCELYNIIRPSAPFSVLCTISKETDEFRSEDALFQCILDRFYENRVLTPNDLQALFKSDLHLRGEETMTNVPTYRELNKEEAANIVQLIE